MQKKVFSIGLNPLYDRVAFCELLNKYQDYIDSIYFSPTIKIKRSSLNTRHFLDYFAGSTFLKEYTDYVSSYARDLGIKLDMTINNPKVPITSEFDEILAEIEKIDPEEITLTKNLQSFFQQNYKKCFYVYSFNNHRPSQEDFLDPFWSSYAIANAFFWDESIRPKDKEARLILNTGCPSEAPPCFDTVNNNGCSAYCITRCKDPIVFIAYHAWFGEDLRLFETYYGDTKFKYKLTTRNRLTTIESLTRYLDGLIYNLDIKATEFLKNTKNSKIWYCSAPWYQINTGILSNFNFQTFKNTKIKLWQKTDPAIHDFQGNFPQIYDGSKSTINISFLNSLTVSELNLVLINLYKRICSTTELNLSEIEEALLKKYSLIIERIGQKAFIKTKKTGALIFREKEINPKINYIDRILKIDSRYLFEQELVALQFYLKYPDKNFSGIKKFTYQKRLQLAENGRCQKRFGELYEALYKQKYTLLHQKYIDYQTAKILATQPSQARIVEAKQDLTWNNAYSSELYKNTKQHIQQLISK